ncbi:MAG TPA: Rrf2 family transcriptional regulator [Ignavibacteriaceae bacterium]|nr:Rrf2 family transcriptional regulator [Ignavibacteriaceae bacterium]
MLKLSKKSEYALMAMRYLAMSSDGKYATARDISQYYDIPYELVAKVLQQLVKKNLVSSLQGVRGGYSLVRAPEQISLMEIISAIEDNYQITNCMNENSSQKDCSHFECCMIRDPLIKVQREIDKVFQNMKIIQII